MQTFFQDIRFGCRMLLRNPGFTVAALLCLGLGIGGMTAIFSVVNGVILRPLPYRDPERLVSVCAIHGTENNPPSIYFSSADYHQYWKAHSRSYEDLAIFYPRQLAFDHGDATELLDGLCISPNIFQLLGLQPALGRTFLPDEYWPNPCHSIILGHEFWVRSCNARTDMIGKSIKMGNENYTVVGIMPPGIRVPLNLGEYNANVPVDFWLPKDIRGKRHPEFPYVGAGFIIGRLKTGVTPDQALAELEVLEKQTNDDHPMALPEFGPMSFAIAPFQRVILGDYRPGLLMLFGVAFFVLLIAIANVSIMLMVRAMARRHEFALRAAHGAGRFRLVRQLLVESVLLTLLGGLAGWILAKWELDVLLALAPRKMPLLQQVGMDSSVFGFTLAICLLSGIAVGLLASFCVAGNSLYGVLKESATTTSAGAGHRRLISIFVIAEIALTLILLTGAGLLINSFIHLGRVDLGYETKNLLTMRMSYSDMREFSPQMAQIIVQKTRSLPGVQSAAMTLGGQLFYEMGGDKKIIISPSTSPTAGPDYGQATVSLEYFGLMGIPLLRGRLIQETDQEKSAPVVIISQSMARAYWPGQNPIGKHFSKPNSGSLGQNMEIVGIVGDIISNILDPASTLMFYMPQTQYPALSRRLLIRTNRDPQELISAVRKEIHDIDPEILIFSIMTVEEKIAEILNNRRLMMTLLGGLSILALILSVSGIYGVMAYSVAQRTHEIGVRIAMGAQRRDIIRLVVGQGLVLIGIGVMIGLAGAFALTRLIASQLYGVTATDPWTFAGVTILLAAVALSACYIPARRATKIDPMEVLRWE